MLKLKLKGNDNFTLSNYQISDPEYKRTTWKINQVVLGMKDVDSPYTVVTVESSVFSYIA